MDVLYDPLLRGPFWASTLLAGLLSIIGVITFHSRKPLLGEVVAHCSYPGAIMGLIVSIFLGGIENPLVIMTVAFIFAFLGVFLLKKFEGVQSQDSSMTLVLSGFFGLGILFTSLVQQTYPKFYRLAQGYLFGQVSTMTDWHIGLYVIALVVCVSIIRLIYPRLSLRLFDPMQSKVLGSNKLELVIEAMICLCLVLGIRGIGVVLVSSFFVAPSLVTLRFCRTLKSSLWLAALLAVALNIVVFTMSLKAPLAPVLVLLMTLVATLTLKRKAYESLS